MIHILSPHTGMFIVEINIISFIMKSNKSTNNDDAAAVAAAALLGIHTSPVSSQRATTAAISSAPSTPIQMQMQLDQHKNDGAPTRSDLPPNPHLPIDINMHPVEKFPVILMKIISSADNSDCISWLPHGRSFIITSPGKFTREVLPRYFPDKVKFSSFTRKLFRWGFRQISKGPDEASFFHKLFRRDNKTLCAQIFCKEEIRDGCPELHKGINAQSLAKLDANDQIRDKKREQQAASRRAEKAAAREEKKRKKLASRSKPVQKQQIASTSSRRRMEEGCLDLIHRHMRQIKQRRVQLQEALESDMRQTQRRCQLEENRLAHLLEVRNRALFFEQQSSQQDVYRPQLGHLTHDALHQILRQAGQVQAHSSSISARSELPYQTIPRANSSFQMSHLQLDTRIPVFPRPSMHVPRHNSLAVPTATSLARVEDPTNYALPFSLTANLSPREGHHLDSNPTHHHLSLSHASAASSEQKAEELIKYDYPLQLNLAALKQQYDSLTRRSAGANNESAEDCQKEEDSPIPASMSSSSTSRNASGLPVYRPTLNSSSARQA